MLLTRICSNNIRMWDSKPKRGFDLQSFNAGDYDRAVQASNSASTITSVLYPNDNHYVGKELRLKQQVCGPSFDLLRF